jgi:nitrate/nitrite-specific signal transduction histidine kinase
MANTANAAEHSGTPPKRYLRNYLLDARFQLKFTAYAVSATLVVAALLGVFLYMTTQELFRETESAVDARSKASETSKELGNAALSNTLLEHFNDPGFEKQLREQSKAIDDKYEAEKREIVAQYGTLKRQQRATVWALVGGLLGFVLFVAVGAILVTHKIVGPLFRFKRMAQDIGTGKLRMPQFGLRQGDEFQDFFELMTRMTQYLRDLENSDVKTITQALQDAEKAGMSSASLAPLREMIASKQRRLDA